MSETVIESGESGRAFSDAVGYAVGHRIRVELLAALNDLGAASAIELARVVHQPLSTVTHHITELHKLGALRVERTRKVRSVEQRYYAATSTLHVTDDELAAMSEEERQEAIGITLQAMVAEALSAFWSGNLTSDPRVVIAWSWFNVDAQGREEIADEQLRSWRRFSEIERRAQARCEESGERPSSVMVSSLGFRRSRTAPRPANAPDGP